MAFVNPARVLLGTLTNVRPKWVLTTTQAAALLEALPPLAPTMVGLALPSGLRRGELFALRWSNFDEQARCLTVCEAVYSVQRQAARSSLELLAHVPVPSAVMTMKVRTRNELRASRSRPSITVDVGR